MPRVNRSRYAVLGALSVGPRTGYEIQRDLAGTVGHFWTESFGQIYPILRELLETGEVAVAEEEGEGRGRKAYRITPAGQRALQAWLREPPAPMSVRNELLLKLFFGGLAPPDVAIGHLHRAAADAEAALGGLMGIAEQIEREERDSEMFPYFMSTVQAGIAGFRAHMQWCADSIALLERHGAKRPKRARSRKS